MKLNGTGKVWRQHDNEYLGEFRYELSILAVKQINCDPPKNSFIEPGKNIIGTVQGLDAVPQDQRLTLEIDDGRCLDFCLDKDKTIKPKGGLYSK